MNWEERAFPTDASSSRASGQESPIVPGIKNSDEIEVQYYSQIHRAPEAVLNPPA